MSTVLVTGANRGLGLEFARQYANEGWRVHACVRSPSQELTQIGGVTVHQLDVTDFAAVDALARELNEVAVDVLINNAGSMGRSAPFGATNFADWEAVFRLNVFAPMKMAEAFVQHVARSEQKKMVSITSLMASIEKNEMGAFYHYRASKAALNAMMRSMAIDLGRQHKIIATVIHPGWARTDMGGPRAELLPAESVSGMRQVIASLTSEKAGRFWAYDGTEAPW